MKLKDFDFRIWDNGQKYVGDVVKKYIGLQGFSDDAEVELWTGYIDSKGTRIYKNDIIRTDKGEIFIVAQDGEFSAWGLLDKDGIPCCSMLEFMFKSDRMEVIGNIHEK